MIKLNWNLLWKKAKLDTLDVVACVVLGLLAALLVVVASLTSSGSSYAVKESLGTSINQGITSIFYWLDSFAFADNAVTFLFWSGIGLLLYIVVSSGITLTQEVSYEHDLSSDEYVHPNAKSKKQIIVSGVVEAITFALCLLLLVGALALVVFAVLPALIVHGRTLALQPSFPHGLGFAAAIALLIVSLGAVWFAGKLCMHRQLILDV